MSISIFNKKHTTRKLYLLLLIVLLAHQQKSFAQQQKINWLTFEQLEDSLAVAPKKVFISFYADWCAYCKKMDEVAFKDPNIIEVLSSDYYAVKMNAEALDPITFEGRVYENKEKGVQRNPKHELALLLASRKGQPFTLPATLMLNEEFEVTQRYFNYLSAKALFKILQQ